MKENHYNYDHAGDSLEMLSAGKKDSPRVAPFQTTVIISATTPPIQDKTRPSSPSCGPRRLAITIFWSRVLGIQTATRDVEMVGNTAWSANRLGLRRKNIQTWACKMGHPKVTRPVICAVADRALLQSRWEDATEARRLTAVRPPTHALPVTLEV